MDQAITKYLRTIGKKGGLKSRRKLSPEDAQTMVRVREARKAFRKFYTSCFWSFKKDYRITKNDLSWTAEQLKKHGNQEAWEIATKICP